MALNFPSSPINGQIYFDASSGNRYVYDSANTIWTYAANNSLVGSANSQILFNNEGSIDGSDALVFEANTLYPQEIVVTQNATATYYFGNGAFLTGITATSGISMDYPYANGVANSANSYAVTIGASSNAWANSLSTIDRAMANGAANSANAYTITVGAAGNTSAYMFANGTANAANAYAVTVGAAGNTAAYIFANGVGNAVNAFASATYYAKSGGTVSGDVVITGNLTVSGQTTYSNTNTLLVGDNIVTLNADIPGTAVPIENAGIEVNRGVRNANAQLIWIEAANAWGFTSNSRNTITTYIASNTDVVNAGTGANNYAITVGTAGNTYAMIFANGVANSSNAYTVTVGAAANATHYIYANNVANNANAYAGTLWTNALINGNNSANSANAYTVTVGAAANATHYIYANGTANSANAYALTLWTNALINANNDANSANSFANTKLANTSGVSFAGNLFSPAGNVGIGTGIATANLHVVGNTYINGTGNAIITTGNVNAQYYYGNGAFLTGISASGGTGLANTSGVAFNGNLYFPAGNVSIGYGNDQNYRLAINGSFVANTKSFVIPHPTREGMTLRYGSLEGPENGVYVRGLCDSFSIELPDYWIGLVHEDSITISLTPIGYYQKLYVEHIANNVVYVSTDNNTPPYCHYHIFAERKDVEKLVVEF